MPTPTFYDFFRQNPRYGEVMMRDRLGIADTDEFGKKHCQWLDELAEANDELGTCQGWCFTKGIVNGRTNQADYVRIPVIEIIFDHGIVTVNYELTLLSKRLMHRIDENVRRERWVFTDAELLADGQNCKSDDEFIAHVQDAELGVFVERNGTVTNRWEDGVVGVPQEVIELASDVDSLVAENGELAENWRSVKINDDDTWIIEHHHVE